MVKENFPSGQNFRLDIWSSTMSSKKCPEIQVYVNLQVVASDLVDWSRT